MNLEGTVYFIQPTELKETNKYKIGMSKENNLNRLIKGYRKGTRFISVMSCKYPKTLECIIKRNFIIKYKLIAGTEFFEGKEEDMLKDFLQIINQNKDVEIKSKEITIIDKDIDIVDKDTQYKCISCNKLYMNYKSLWKHNYVYHREGSLKIIKKIFTEKSINSCKFCEKQLSRKDNLIRHEKKCKKKDNNIKENDHIKNLEKKLFDMKQIIEKLESVYLKEKQNDSLEVNIKLP